MFLSKPVKISQSINYVFQSAKIMNVGQNLTLGM